MNENEIYEDMRNQRDTLRTRVTEMEAELAAAKEREMNTTHDPVLPLKEPDEWGNIRDSEHTFVAGCGDTDQGKAFAQFLVRAVNRNAAPALLAAARRGIEAERLLSEAEVMLKVRGDETTSRRINTFLAGKGEKES